MSKHTQSCSPSTNATARNSGGGIITRQISARSWYWVSISGRRHSSFRNAVGAVRADDASAAFRTTSNFSIPTIIRTLRLCSATAAQLPEVVLAEAEAACFRGCCTCPCLTFRSVVQHSLRRFPKIGTSRVNVIQIEQAAL